MRIELSPEAEADLLEIAEYIAQDRPAVAVRVIARIEQSIHCLEFLPNIGRPGILPNTRELSIYKLPYKIVGSVSVSYAHPILV
ncbi:MAG: type II toxin-antitoxin system RelE/ParE family toxin [Alphaproteobacteria bacterium]|nr:type II toxin-antitoxin system RelE/ParE family toxin [Alphaproteobacteria bacterium]